MPVSSAGDAAGNDEPLEVHCLRLKARRASRLVRGVERAGDEPGCDEHEHRRRHAEEARQVDLHAAAVDAPCRAPATRTPSAAPPPAAVGLRRVERGEQEHRRLEALADDGEERHRDERQPDPLASAPRARPRAPA